MFISSNTLKHKARRQTYELPKLKMLIYRRRQEHNSDTNLNY